MMLSREYRKALGYPLLYGLTLLAGSFLFGVNHPLSAESAPKELALVGSARQETSSKRKTAMVKLYPVDEAGKDRSFRDFRQRLLAAINKRDSQFILDTIHPEIRLGFGGERGRQMFEKEWQPEKKTSPFWTELKSILLLGGAFENSDQGKVYCAPYVSSRWREVVNRFPQFANADQYAVVLRRNVSLYSEPSQTSSAIRVLSFDIVKLSPPGLDENTPRWVKVNTLDGSFGYIRAQDIRSPIDYSACFRNESGRWMMISFIAGD